MCDEEYCDVHERDVNAVFALCSDPLQRYLNYPVFVVQKWLYISDKIRKARESGFV
jgi:hypothetical protein